MSQLEISHVIHVPRTITDVDTNILLCFDNNTQFMYCQLAIKSSDHINSEKKLILRLIILAAIISYCSISALKCYKCTDIEDDAEFTGGRNG